MISKKIMNYRGYFASSVFIFNKTALPFALVWSVIFFLMGGGAFVNVLFYGTVAGCAFGIVGGLVMATFIRGKKTNLIFSERNAFQNALTIALAKIGYHPENQCADVLTFKPSPQAGSLSGEITVSVGDKVAVLIGPAIYVTRVTRLLLDSKMAAPS